MFSCHTLKNGIRIILAPQRDTKAVALEVLIKAGSRHESKNENGIAHFLEHLMFKGTKRRPSTLAIAQELDSIGADYNGYTAKDHTGFYVKAESAHLPLAADMLADILTGSIFASEEVERERGTILEEINMYEDNPMARVAELFEQDLFGRQSSLGRRVIGEPAVIRAVSPRAIVRFWQKHYHGANTVLSLAGRFNSREAMKLLADKFGAIKRGKRNETPRVIPTESHVASTPPPFAKGGGRDPLCSDTAIGTAMYKGSLSRWPSASGKQDSGSEQQEVSARACLERSVKDDKVGARIHAYHKDTNQAHVVMGWPGLHNNHPDRFALSLLSIILGGNMSSRLFIKVRERLGLCYFIHSAAASYEDVGTFAIQAGLDLGKIDKAFAAISEEIKDMRAGSVSSQELQKAKQFVRGKITLSLEDAQDVAAYFGKQVMFERQIFTPARLFAKFERVSLSDVKRLANGLLTRRRLRLTALSPLRDLSKFAKFLDM